MSRQTLRDRLRPLELLGLAAVFAIVTAVVILVATRDLTLTGVFGGVAFIVALVALAMLALSATAGEAEQAMKDARGEGDGPRGHA